MSEPADASAPPPAPSTAPPETAPARRFGGATLAVAAAIVVVVALVAASPFWAPAAMHALPWSPQAKPATPDPALATAKAEADRNATTVQQLTQKIAALEARPAPDLNAVTQKLAALEAKPPPDLAPLQQRLAVLEKAVADLTAGVATLDKTAQSKPATDPKNTALALVLLQIRDAVDIGRPFDAEYQTLLSLAGDHADIATAAAPLAVPAKTGVASRAVLTARLHQLAPRIATAEAPADTGWQSRVMARLSGLVTIRRIDGEGQTPAEAATSTAERAMAAGDLAGAVEALNGLSGANAAAAEPWLKMARDRLAVEAALRRVAVTLTAALGAAPAQGRSPGQGG